MEKKILSGAEMAEVIGVASQEIKKDINIKKLVIVGIHRRGAVLADRLSRLIASKQAPVPTGYLDITLYRDDFSKVGAHPLVKGTDMLFDIDGQHIVLVDDVLYTGRTIRAALDAIMDIGRPASVRLFVLVDRGHRELPIKADYAGKKIATQKKEMVEVRVKEIDGRDEVVIK